MMFKSLIYALKKFQFTFKTWKNSVQISQAYGASSRRGVSFGQAIKEGMLWIFMAVIIISLTAFAVVKYADMKKRHPRPAPRIELTDRTPDGETAPQPNQGAFPGVAVSNKPAAVDTPSRTEPILPVPVKPTVKKYDYVPSTDTSDFLVLVANKASKAMYVLQKQQSTWRVVREYSIAIGAQEGRKVTAGDKRTPEGLYCIVGRKEKNELALIYGPLAYVLDYPNDDDRHAGRTGQGIWIHGTAPDSLPFQTRGCLEMDNRDLSELALLLKKGVGTPVLIVSDSGLSDIASLPDYALCKQRREIAMKIGDEVTVQFRELLTSWKSAWESRDIGKYEVFYDTARFSGQGLAWGGWKERKLRTFGLYDTIAISIDKMKIVRETDSKLMVKFLQRYTTNLNSIENGKKMWFEKVNDFWKITGESTCSKEELLL